MNARILAVVGLAVALTGPGAARALEPESILVAGYSGVNLMVARRYDEALEESARWLERAYERRTQACPIFRRPALPAHPDRNGVDPGGGVPYAPRNVPFRTAGTREALQTNIARERPS